jgi:hypothetical protein
MTVCPEAGATADRLGEIANKIFSVETVRPAEVRVFDNRR